ncbi:MAG TPA: protein kinase [Kofleriaceae bacterium]|nr:protein kinase [Kofleriaceae bacterium]
MSLSASVPRDSAQGRDFLQRRIALFARVLFFLDFGFFVLVRILELVAGMFDPGIFLVWSELAHLASCAVLAAMWIVCSRGRHSPAALAWIDAGGLVLVGLFYGMMGGTAVGEPGMPFAITAGFMSLVMIIALTNTMIARAVLVPSSPRRTLWISIAATAPMLAAIVYLRVFRSEMPPVHKAIGVVQFAAYAALPVIISTVASRVIYGLRQRVREAITLGQYTLEEKIGEGGMGVVYRARHAMLRRSTAIKLLPPDKAGEQNLGRFEREVQLTSQLTHPNTVAIYDYGRTPDGVFYYAMEFLDGVDLEGLVRAEGPQPPDRVVHILTQVCGALGEAHAVGLIHRDIKPANIILCERGGMHDVAKVVDFGLVKDLDSSSIVSVSVTAAHVITGTPLYLSPEAIRAPDQIDARSDLYALGAVGYFLLTAKPVFESNSVIELCGQHLHAEPVPPSLRLGRPLPEALSRVLLRCLAKQPADRPASAGELRAALLATGVEPWTEEEAGVWWQKHGAAMRARRHAAAAPVEPHAATIAVDLRRRRPRSLPAAGV